MKVLVIGQGGREHAIVRALRSALSVTEVHAMPGSEGMGLESVCHNVDLRDAEAVVALVERHNFDLIVIGPEAPLAEGLSDALRKAGRKVFGPSREAAELEASKIFAKKFMTEAQVPTARYKIVQSVDEVLNLAREFTPPYVLKADGLAAGKGVYICQNLTELKAAAEDLFDKKVLGAAGQRALLEQYHAGWELSFLILTNGESYASLPLAQDHKRLRDNDLGPNTGGMGCVAPLKISAELELEIHSRILEPSVHQLKKLGLLYRGILYVGVMVTDQGSLVLEYNVRFGDPEAQVLLPLLDGDWGQVFAKVAAGEVPEVRWKPLHVACVVLAAEGYPEHPIKGALIEGEIQFSSVNSYFLHAGTALEKNGCWVTHGGRVLNALGLGSSRAEALKNAYRQAEKVNWQGLQKRRDIGEKANDRA